VLQITVSQINKLIEWILRLPILWGGVAALAFYAALDQGWINIPLLNKYMAGHPVEYIIGSMFFIGLAALAMRFIDVTAQFASIGSVELSPPALGGSPLSECETLLAELGEQSAALQNNYLSRRLREAIEFVRRKDSADSMEQHLRYLEDQDALRMNANYALSRIIIWAIPILGLLGTVIGITIAITNLKPETLEQSLTEVTSGLGVAFDHTGQALTLTMILMFIKFGVERAEGRLMTIVDERAAEELIGRFQYMGTDGDPNVASIRRMSEQVIGAVESLASRQAEVWRTSIDETHQQWADVSSSTGKVIQDSLAVVMRQSLEEHARRLNEGTHLYADKLSRSSNESVGHLREGLEKLAELLVESLHRHGEALTASEKELAQENRRHLSEVEAALGESMVVAADRQESLIKQSENLLKEMQIALVEAAEATVRQQEQLVKQGDVMLQVVGATGQVKQLEDALNENLSALANTQHFDEMALNLTAAIQLLCARMGYSPLRQVAGGEPHVTKSPGHAA
jgi:biopolymer transport protein ExbB/TolQ